MSVQSPENCLIGKIPNLIFFHSGLPVGVHHSVESVNNLLTETLSPVPTPVTTHCDLLSDTDVAKLALEIEKERMEYLKKSKYLQQQLRELKSEIEVLKVEDHFTSMDRIHEENVHRGDNKYSTLRKTKSGTTRTRVAFFEDL